MILGLILAGAFYATVVLAWLVGQRNGVTAGGAPLFFDYATFRQAGRFALEGHASRAYDDAAMMAAQLATFPGSTTRLPWNYPPSFQLLLMPLAAVPHAAGFIAFGLGGVLALLAARRRFMAALPVGLAVLAPGVFANLLLGQNGLFALALLVVGVGSLRQRPVVAGVALGLLALKPQLALAVPIALLASRAWRALLAAAASQAALAAVAAVGLGVDAWWAFLAKAAHPAAVIGGSSSSRDTVPSLGVLARQLGAGASVAALGQLVGAVLAGVVLARQWRKGDDPLALLAGLGAASLLIAPYLRPYDLVLLLPVTALACRDGSQAGWVLKLAGLAAWLAPALLMFTVPPLQYGALVSLLGLLAVATRKAAPGAIRTR